MKNWSYWAKANKWKARLLIVFISISIALLGIFVGLGLDAWDIHIPFWLAISPGLLTLWLIAIFSKRKAYRIKRRIHFSLGIMGFLSAIILANIFSFQVSQIVPEVSQLTQKSNPLVHFASQKPPESIKKGKSLFRLGLFDMQKVKKKAQALKKAYKKTRVRYRRLSRGGAFVLFLLSSFGALGLSVVLAAFACNASCSGVAATAAFLGMLSLLTFAGCIALFIYAIYRLVENIEPSPPPTTPPEAPSNSKG